MDSHTVIHQILSTNPVIPVVVIERLDDAEPLARTIRAAGIRAIEVTLRSDCALQAIRRIRDACSDMYVGVGTVKNTHDLQAAHHAGAQFAFSPGITERLLDASKTLSLPFVPGVSTISDIMLGIEYALRYFKLFPARCVNGISFLKAVHGPFPELLFCPTGGVRADNIREYLAQPNVISVGGSWMVPSEKIQQHDWAAIGLLCENIVNIYGDKHKE